MKTLSLRLPDSLDARLATMARRRRVAKARLAREALEALVGNGKSRQRSVLEVAGHLIGCVEGPGDLSTNPKHMEGFGR